MLSIKGNRLFYYLEFENDIVILNNTRICDLQLYKKFLNLNKNLLRLPELIYSIENVDIEVIFDDKLYDQSDDEHIIDLKVNISFFDELILTVPINIIIVQNVLTNVITIREKFANNYKWFSMNNSISDFKLEINNIISKKVNELSIDFKVDDFIKFKKRFHGNRYQNNKCYKFDTCHSFVNTSNFLESISYNEFRKTRITKSFSELCNSILNSGYNINLRQHFFEIEPTNSRISRIKIQNDIIIVNSEPETKKLCKKFLYYILVLDNYLNDFISECEKILINGHD